MRKAAPSHIPPVLMLGTVSQVGQVLFLREFLMLFHGSELSIGIVLAAWLAWVGIGSRLGAVLVGRSRDPLLLLPPTAGGVVLALPGTVLLIRILRGFFDLLPGAYLTVHQMAVCCFLLMAPACLLLGIQFVLLARVWRERDRASDTSGAGKTYVGEAAGNVAGGVAFTFFMVHRLTPLESAVAAAVPMLAAAIWATWGRASGRTALPRRVSLGLLVAVLATFPFLGTLDDWAYRVKWTHLTPGHELVDTRQSKHGTISVLRRDDQYSFFQSGHLMFTTAGPETASPGLEDQEAVILAHLAMLQHPKPGRVLLIGGGLSGVLGEILEHPVREVDYVELDEVLTAAARPYISQGTLEALADPRVNLLHIDGRLFVRTAGTRYDVVIVDVPDPATAVLNRYYTREFFTEARSLLNTGGVLVIGATSTPDLRGTAVANRNATIYHTLRSVFPGVIAAGDRFLLFFATDEAGQVTVSAADLRQRYVDRGVESGAFSAGHLETLLPDPQLRRINWVLRHHGRTPDAHLAGPGPVPLAPGTLAEQDLALEQLPPVIERFFINTDLTPILSYHSLMFWDGLTRAGPTSAFRWLLLVRPWWIIPLLAIPLLVALALRIGARPYGPVPGARFGIMFAVFSTGLSTMALQIALLFSFQSMYGFVYEVVGLIIAVFMCGLSLGALATQIRVRSGASFGALMAFQLLIAVFSGLLALLLPHTAAIGSPAAVLLLFSVLTFASGLVNGVDFPLSAACLMAISGRAEGSAGRVYGVELLGSCVGAFAASAFVAPVLGIAACCLVACLGNATALVVLFISRRSYLCVTGTHPARDSAGGNS